MADEAKGAFSKLHHNCFYRLPATLLVFSFTQISSTLFSQVNHFILFFIYLPVVVLKVVATFLFFVLLLTLFVFVIKANIAVNFFLIFALNAVL